MSSLAPGELNPTQPFHIMMARLARTRRTPQRHELRTPKELVRRAADDIDRGLQDTECRGSAKPANCPPTKGRRKAPQPR
jgi:hypothetical protein